MIPREPAAALYRRLSREGVKRLTHHFLDLFSRCCPFTGAEGQQREKRSPWPTDAGVPSLRCCRHRVTPSVALDYSGCGTSPRLCRPGSSDPPRRPFVRTSSTDTRVSAPDRHRCGLTRLTVGRPSMTSL